MTADHFMVCSLHALWLLMPILPRGWDRLLSQVWRDWCKRYEQGTSNKPAETMFKNCPLLLVSTLLAHIEVSPPFKKAMPHTSSVVRATSDDWWTLYKKSG